MKRVKHGTYPTLAAWREAVGLSQMEAARVLGVNQTTYSRYERRVNRARGARALKIWRQTGVPLEILVGVA